MSQCVHLQRQVCCGQHVERINWREELQLVNTEIRWGKIGIVSVDIPIKIQEFVREHLSRQGLFWLKTWGLKLEEHLDQSAVLGNQDGFSSSLRNQLSRAPLPYARGVRVRCRNNRNDNSECLAGVKHLAKVFFFYCSINPTITVGNRYYIIMPTLQRRKMKAQESFGLGVQIQSQVAWLQRS